MTNRKKTDFFILSNDKESPSGSANKGQGKERETSSINCKVFGHSKVKRKGKKLSSSSNS